MSCVAHLGPLPRLNSDTLGFLLIHTLSEMFAFLAGIVGVEGHFANILKLCVYVCVCVSAGRTLPANRPEQALGAGEEEGGWH